MSFFFLPFGAQAREGRGPRREERESKEKINIFLFFPYRSWPGRSRTSTGCGRRRASPWPVYGFEFCFFREKRSKGKSLRGSERTREREQSTVNREELLVISPPKPWSNARAAGFNREIVSLTPRSGLAKRAQKVQKTASERRSHRQEASKSRAIEFRCHQWRLLSLYLFPPEFHVICSTFRRAEKRTLSSSYLTLEPRPISTTALITCGHGGPSCFFEFAFFLSRLRDSFFSLFFSPSASPSLLFSKRSLYLCLDGQVVPGMGSRVAVRLGHGAPRKKRGRKSKKF